MTPVQSTKIAEQKFFAAKVRQELEEVNAQLAKSVQEKQQIQQEYQQSQQHLAEKVHLLQLENQNLMQKNEELQKEIEQRDAKQVQLQRQLEQILVCGQRFCLDGSTYMANCDGTCRPGQVWGSSISKFDFHFILVCYSYYLTAIRSIHQFFSFVYSSQTCRKNTSRWR